MMMMACCFGRRAIVVRASRRAVRQSEQRRADVGRPPGRQRLRQHQLHQHRVHGPQARRREGNPVSDPGRDLPESVRRIDRVVGLRQQGGPADALRLVQD